MITYTEMVAKDAHKQAFNNNYRYGGANTQVLYHRLKMAKEREVARALSLIDPDNFNIFGDRDQAALMTLVEDYFCGDDPQEMSDGKLLLANGNWLPLSLFIIKAMKVTTSL